MPKQRRRFKQAQSLKQRLLDRVNSYATKRSSWNLASNATRFCGRHVKPRLRPISTSGSTLLACNRRNRNEVSAALVHLYHRHANCRRRWL